MFITVSVFQGVFVHHSCGSPWWPEQVSYPLELEIQVIVNHSTWVIWNLGHLEEEKTLLSYLSQFILNNSFLTKRTKDNNWLGDFRDMDPPSEQFRFLSLAKSQKCLGYCPRMSGRQGFQKGFWSLVFSLSLLCEHLCPEAVHERIINIPGQTLTLLWTALEFFLWSLYLWQLKWEWSRTCSYIWLLGPKLGELFEINRWGLGVGVPLGAGLRFQNSVLLPGSSLCLPACEPDISCKLTVPSLRHPACAKLPIMMVTNSSFNTVRPIKLFFTTISWLGHGLFS